MSTGVPTDRWQALGFLAGLGLTSVSLSSGFIWAKQGAAPLVFAAAFGAWWGYLFAHYALTGEFIDAATHDDPPPTERDLAARARAAVAAAVPDDPLRRLGVVVGTAVLVAGMVVGVVYIREGNHLMTNVGGFLFLGGYAIAHYVETGIPV